MPEGGPEVDGDVVVGSEVVEGLDLDGLPLLLQTQPVLQVIQILDLLLHQLDALEQVLLLLVREVESLLAVLQHLGWVLVVVDLSDHLLLVLGLNALYLVPDGFHVQVTQEERERVQVHLLGLSLSDLLQEHFDRRVDSWALLEGGLDHLGALALTQNRVHVEYLLLLLLYPPLQDLPVDLVVLHPFQTLELPVEGVYHRRVHVRKDDPEP